MAEQGSVAWYATALAVVGAWSAIVFVSVLVHELGHALVARLFGHTASIRLVWLGGHTRPHVHGPLPWHQDVLLSVAGPLFGLLLGAGSLGALFLLPQPASAAGFLLEALGLANLFWGAVNLLPVMPLDGGRISWRLCVRLFGRRGFLLSQLLGLALAAAGAALAWKVGEPFLAAFLLFFGMQTVGLLQAYFRGEGPPGTEAHPEQEPLLQEAEEALRAERLEEARARAQEVLSREQVRPSTAARAHLLLGWVALKEGEGRRALDHFSQVQGLRVAPHALAAAFSLVGDELRALPLWEMAWRETGDATVLHEWAGALLRAGQRERVARLPGVDQAQAYACATRVLALRGAWSEAAALGEEALAVVPRAHTAYEAACAHAQAGNTPAALRLLHQASELGFRDAEYAATDADLTRLHAEPAFAGWLAALRNSAAS
jgi:Zn-dependent protease